MTEPNTFVDFLARIRAGDNEAAAELVRRYEEAIRREVRLRLRDARLRRVLESLDICQSVLGSFFVRVAAGQYDLNDPTDLLKLLIKMARNKVVSAARRHQSQRRDHRRIAADGSAELKEAASALPGPSTVIERKDLLQEFRHRLNDEERQLMDWRNQGYDWPTIAAQLGGTPQARRAQLVRAVDRVAQELRLDED
jgi:RNA polymerase sigma-70 factor (ECF subfamily)